MFTEKQIMAFGRVFGIISLFVLLLTSLQGKQVRGAHHHEKEIIARKLIKLFLATALLSPPGVGKS